MGKRQHKRIGEKKRRLKEKRGWRDERTDETK